MNLICDNLNIVKSIKRFKKYKNDFHHCNNFLSLRTCYLIMNIQINVLKSINDAFTDGTKCNYKY